MTNGDSAEPGITEQFGNVTRSLRLATARANGANSDNRLHTLNHCVLWAKQAEVSTGSHDTVGNLHHSLVVQIRIGQDATVCMFTLDLVFKILFIPDGKAMRVERARKNRGIQAALNVGDLSSSEA